MASIRNFLDIIPEVAEIAEITEVWDEVQQNGIKPGFRLMVPCILRLVVVILRWLIMWYSFTFSLIIIGVS